jgi:hypothetical protein
MLSALANHSGSCWRGTKQTTVELIAGCEETTSRAQPLFYHQNATARSCFLLARVDFNRLEVRDQEQVGMHGTALKTLLADYRPKGGKYS